MKIIHRHYIKEFLKMLGIIAFGLAIIFSLLDLINKIDDFIPGKLSIVRLIQYILLNLPKYLYYLLPMSLLVCSLFIFSHASRNKELIAIKATGGRIKVLFYPFIVLGILASLFAFVIGEIIIPDFSERSLEFQRTFMKKVEKVAFKEGTLWLRGTDGSLIRIGLYIPSKRIAKDISIFTMGEEYLKERIEAEEAVWFENYGSKNIWKLKKVIIYDVERGKINNTPEMEYPYLESPDLFSKGMKSPDEMGIAELYTYSKRLEAAGIRDSKLSVDLNSKISYPLANFFMILLGISLSVMSRIGGGLMAAGLGIFISFIYWLFYTLMLSMGFARILPPVVATWIVPVLFGIVAVYLFRKIPE